MTTSSEILMKCFKDSINLFKEITKDGTASKEEITEKMEGMDIALVLLADQISKFYKESDANGKNFFNSFDDIDLRMKYLTYRDTYFTLLIDLKTLNEN